LKVEGRVENKFAGLHPIQCVATHPDHQVRIAVWVFPEPLAERLELKWLNISSSNSIHGHEGQQTIKRIPQFYILAVICKVTVSYVLQNPGAIGARNV